MIVIENNKIKIIQGDTGVIDLKIDNYIFKTGDKVYFTVKEDYNTKSIIDKIITIFPESNKVVIQLTSEDTNIEPKSYMYDIQLSLADGRVDTVVPPSRFVVLGGITGV